MSFLLEKSLNKCTNQGAERKKCIEEFRYNNGKKICRFCGQEDPTDRVKIIDDIVENKVYMRFDSEEYGPFVEKYGAKYGL